MLSINQLIGFGVNVNQAIPLNFTNNTDNYSTTRSVVSGNTVVVSKPTAADPWRMVVDYRYVN